MGRGSAVATGRATVKIRNVSLSLAVLAVIGCNEQPTGPTTAEFNEGREALKNRVAARKEGRAPAAGQATAAAGKSAPQAAGGDLGAVERDFIYDATGKRDPFRSFLLDRSSDLAELAVRGPLEQFDLTQLSVEAVVWQTGNARALIADPAGETYIVAEGARIGKNEGRIIAIEDNLIRVKETYLDYLGRETTKDIEIRMRRNEGG